MTHLYVLPVFIEGHKIEVNKNICRMKPAINQLLTDDVDKSFDQGKVQV